jgi:hypothetical protein
MSTPRVPKDESALRAKPTAIKDSKKDKAFVVLDNVPVPPRPKQEVPSTSVKRTV